MAQKNAEACQRFVLFIFSDHPHVKGTTYRDRSVRIFCDHPDHDSLWRINNLLSSVDTSANASQRINAVSPGSGLIYEREE